MALGRAVANRSLDECIGGVGKAIEAEQFAVAARAHSRRAQRVGTSTERVDIADARDTECTQVCEVGCGDSVDGLARGRCSRSTFAQWGVGKMLGAPRSNDFAEPIHEARGAIREPSLVTTFARAPHVGGTLAWSRVERSEFEVRVRVDESGHRDASVVSRRAPRALDQNDKTARIDLDANGLVPALTVEEMLDGIRARLLGNQPT